jgi:hypothetical protein
MKKSFFVATLFSVLSVSAFAGEAKVTWGDLSKFTDIVEGQENRANFQERLVKEFDDVFNQYSNRYLPEGYQLEVKVTDLDLAGDVRPMVVQAGMMRIVSRIYWPTMSFDYVLKNAQNEIVKSGKANLKDMNFLDRIRIRTGRTGFEYEEKMLSDWFKQQQMDNVFPAKVAE